MNSFYERHIDKIIVVLLVLSVIGLGFVVADRLTENDRFSGGKIVDKYRETRYGTPYVTVLKDGEYRDLDISVYDYLEYDIGDIYNAQE